MSGPSLGEFDDLEQQRYTPVIVIVKDQSIKKSIKKKDYSDIWICLANISPTLKPQKAWWYPVYII